MPTFWISIIQAVYNPAGFSGSSSIASGRSDQGMRKAVEAPMPMRQIMKIKVMNKKRLPVLRNRPPSSQEIFDKGGKNFSQCYIIQSSLMKIS